jgi:hypothetical protein
MYLEERSMRKSGSFARTARTGAVLVAAGVAGAAEAQNRVLNLEASGHVLVPHHPSQNPGANLTIEYWIRRVPGSGNDNSRTVVKTPGSAGAYSIGVYTENQQGLGGTSAWFFGCGAWGLMLFPPGEWVHLAYVCEGGVSVRYYRDGVLVSETGVGSCGLTPGTWDLSFGVSPGFPGTQFFGRLDNIRLWSTARTAQQIAETALVEFTPAQAATMPGLIGSWSFDDGTATDARGVNNGTLQGAATTTIDDGAGLASQFDCNSDGILDAYQIAQGELGDDNANAIPDCCEGSASCIPCPGDIDRNGVANGVDLAMILTAWGTSGAKYPGTDINGDGGVDGADMTFVLSSWGVCP